jgi:hypothetical protein
VEGVSAIVMAGTDEMSAERRAAFFERRKRQTPAIRL